MNKQNFLSFLKQNFLVLIIFVIIFIAGLLTFNDYGQSWDENIMQIYADQSLKNYSEWYDKGSVKLEHEILKYYGPFFMMIVQLVSRFLSKIFQTGFINFDHFVYFIFYFASSISFYTIARRWFGKISSIGSTLLYTLQPVFWGHAFINPKDAPFMSMMIITIAAGFKMVDAIRNFPDSTVVLTNKPRMWVFSSLWLVSILIFFLITEEVHIFITNLVVSAKAGESNIVSIIASKLNQVPAKIYIERYFVLFLQVRSIYTFLSFTFMLYYWYRVEPIILNILGIVSVPAILLGFTTSTRVLGPFVGIIILYYMFRNRSKVSVIAVIAFIIIAISAAYVTWPFLWMNPAGNFLASIQKMSDFPWVGDVLFNGKYYLSTELPFDYLPVLFLIQMTMPVWILAGFGLVFSLFGSYKNVDLLVLFLLWFFVPCLAIVIKNATLFDNFRHVLFILPPIFLLAGNVFERITILSWRIALILICILPGVFGIVSLHPYEYAYYNQFVGGINGASSVFETDYWLTSYREAAKYINQTAPPNAAIWVEGPGHVFTPFAREDLIINSRSSYTEVDSYDYVVVTTRSNLDKTVYPDAEIIYEIKCGNAVLTVIKKP